MSLPVVTVAAGGVPVVDATAGKIGLGVIEATNGRGIAVTKVGNGIGMPVVYESGGGGGPVPGPNVILDPGFDTGAPWGLVNCTISAGALNINGGSNPRATQSCGTMAIPGATYAVSLRVVTKGTITAISITYGGVLASMPVTGTGIVSSTLVAGSVTDSVAVRGTSTQSGVVDDIDVHYVSGP